MYLIKVISKNVEKQLGQKKLNLISFFIGEINQRVNSSDTVDY
jgi:hypothetical protein